jgi:ATP-dependent protease ClpP protease subunit
MAAIAVTIAYFIVFQAVVYPWQIRGMIKACDRYLSGLGSIMTVWGVYFGIAASLLFTAVHVFSAFQSVLVEPELTQLKRSQIEVNRLEEYTLTLTDDGTRIHVKGDIALGITAEMTALLRRFPTVNGIVFNSNGGRVAAGRGLAQLIKRNELDTYVFGTCKSACATAFIGGATRILGRDGKLGFHQFGLATVYTVPFFNPKEEQEQELDFYKERNIAGAFLEKVFQASHSEIWFPSPEELLASGVVHKILTENEK